MMDDGAMKYMLIINLDPLLGGSVYFRGRRDIRFGRTRAISMSSRYSYELGGPSPRPAHYIVIAMEQAGIQQTSIPSVRLRKPFPLGAHNLDHHHHLLSSRDRSSTIRFRSCACRLLRTHYVVNHREQALLQSHIRHPRPHSSPLVVQLTIFVHHRRYPFVILITLIGHHHTYALYIVIAIGIP